MEEHDKVKPLLPSFDHAELIVTVCKLPLDVAARLDQHEADLVREVALADGEHQSVLSKLLRLVLIGGYLLAEDSHLLQLVYYVYFLHQDMGAILHFVAEQVASEN